MKYLKCLAIILSFSLLIAFYGCDYYRDEKINIVLEQTDSNGLIEYQADVSYKTNTARIILLRYKFGAIQDNQIKIELPETIKNKSEKEYPIDSFGGSKGVNAPREDFSLIIEIESDYIEHEPIALTVNVGSLPLDTSYWDNVRICFVSTNAEITIPVEDVKFLSDEPLTYFLSLYEIRSDDLKYNASFSDKWYETPNDYQCGGEKVILKIKHPDKNSERKLCLHNTPLEPTFECDEYIQFEFEMPYHDISITITDTPKQ